MCNAIRIGMSTRMASEIYSNSTALMIVHPSKIANTCGARKIRIHRDGKELTIPLLLGATFPQGVEIVSGIKAGEDFRSTLKQHG